MTKNKRTALLLSILFMLVLLVILKKYSTSHAEDISYTYHCGWVDWKHARPGATKAFVDTFSEQFDKTPLHTTFNITYSQQGGMKSKHYSWCTYGVLKEFEILKFSEDETDKKKLMFQVFKEVCYLFENYQKEVFWGALKTSAFKEGDMMGNLIGFYIACGEMTKEEALELSGRLPLAITEQLQKEGQLGTNATFEPKHRLVWDDEPPVFPSKLQAYKQLEAAADYIRPLRTIRRKTYFNHDYLEEME